MKKIVLLIFAALTFCLGGEPKRGMSAADGIKGMDEEPWNPTATDYVQDGLMAMWDGIENADWGVHNDNPTKWVDLTGRGADWPLGSAFSVEPDGVKIRAQVSWQGQGHCVPSWSASDIKTIEMVIDLSGYYWTSTNMKQIACLAIGTGGNPKGSIFITGTVLSFGSGKPPVYALTSEITSISVLPWMQGVVANGVYYTTSGIAKTGAYVYHAPVLGSYANLPAAIGIKIMALRLYNIELGLSERIRNSVIDKIRFGL